MTMFFILLFYDHAFGLFKYDPVRSTWTNDDKIIRFGPALTTQRAPNERPLHQGDQLRKRTIIFNHTANVCCSFARDHAVSNVINNSFRPLSLPARRRRIACHHKRRMVHVYATMNGKKFSLIRKANIIAPLSSQMEFETPQSALTWTRHKDVAYYNCLA